MATRIEVFQNLSPCSGDRAFVALFEAIGVSEDGKLRITACITFFGKTREEAWTRAHDFHRAELKKEADAAEAAKVRTAKRSAA